MELRGYQQGLIDGVAQKVGEGKRKIVAQGPTGCGKSVIFAGLANRFISATGKKILISVHRDKLMRQARKTIYEWHDILAEPIVAGIRFRNPKSQIYVTMVETAKNRLKKNPMWFGSDIGMVIIDEAHIANHNPLIGYFPESVIVGFTATPLSSSKDRPMKLFYDDIVATIDIPDLIREGALTPNKTYGVKGSVDQKDLKIRNGEFDNTFMSDEFSKDKHIQNCVASYEKYTQGTKAIVFNCNISHSQKVRDAFVEAGYDCRHLGGKTKGDDRDAILHWFKVTPGAILSSVDILTAGFDEPSIQTVIVNRSTLSLPLWLQMTGRGGRLFPGKDYFTILDLGGNARRHMDWSAPRDWVDIFHNPPKKSNKESVPPVKDCVQCEALISASTKTCPFCGALQPEAEIEYDKKDLELALINEIIEIPISIQHNKTRGHNPYKTLHEAKYNIVKAQRDISDKMTTTVAYNMLGLYQMKVQEWCRVMEKSYDQWHKDTTAKWLFEEIERQFNWKVPALSLKLTI